MKYVVVALLINALIPLEGNGQSREFILRAGTLIEQANWKDSIYLLSRFEPAELVFNKGFSSPLHFTLNLNLFTEKMDAITGTGDTLTLKTFEDAHRVRAGNHEFYFEPHLGYLEMLVNKEVSLARLNFFSSGYLINNKRSVLKLDKRDQEANFDRYYYAENIFYLIINDKVYFADRHNLLKAFAENKGVAKRYLHNNKVNYRSKSDMIRATLYLNDLGKIPENKMTDLFRVKAGESIEKEWSDSTYSFPVFREASIKGITGEQQEPLMMNYNVWTGKMDYLNNRDTVEFYNKSDEMVYLGNSLFYKHPSGGYSEVLVQGAHAFCMLKKLKLVQSTLDESSQAVYYKPFSFDDKTYDRLYVIEKSYYFLDKNHQWSEANKASFLRIYLNHNKQIKKYLSEEPVNFRSKSDLLRLLSYCNQL